MPNNRKWLLLPPAVALLIVLGPLSMRSDTTRATDVPQAEVADAQPLPEATPSPKGKANPLPVPRTPDLWQVTSTLIGVLLLGGATLMVLRRMRTAPTTGSTGVVTLRQTLRLAPHKTLHAVEFDGRLLLVGASEKGLQLLHAGGAAADAAADEATIAARSQAAVTIEEDEDEGATPKNLVIPRPPKPQQKLPTPPAVAQEKAQPQVRDLIADFRTLLSKAGR